jgi:hypothetical protein
MRPFSNRAHGRDLSKANPGFAFQKRPMGRFSDVAHVQHLPPEDTMCPFSNAAHAQLFKSLRTIRHGHGRAQQSTRGHDVLLRLLGLGQPSVGDVL